MSIASISMFYPLYFFLKYNYYFWLWACSPITCFVKQKLYNTALAFSPTSCSVKQKAIMRLWYFLPPHGLSSIKSLFNLGIFPCPMLYQTQNHYSTLAFSLAPWFIKYKATIQLWHFSPPAQ
jgi:hypothetical protein